ncbi:MAG: hypothetical protein FPO08_00190 [Geobacter sp.]|nr:MAG: hypothetical protein FPO08_00190 [Geobacter sp.]
MDVTVLNPATHVPGGQYVAFWQYLFATILQGFWARFFGVMFIGLAAYFGIRRRNFQMFVVFFLCAVSITFLAYPLAKLAGLL